MPHKYNLRNQMHSPNYREKTEDDEEDERDEMSEEEEASPRRPQNLSAGYRSPSDTSHLDFSNNSDLSSTRSDSFDYYPGSSPPDGQRKERLYPDLSESLDRSAESSHSPRLRRRDLRCERKASPHSSPDNQSPHRAPGWPESAARQRRPQPEWTTPGKQPVEYTYFGIPGKYWQYIFSIVVVIALVWVLSSVIGKDSDSVPATDGEEVSDFVKFSKQVEGLMKQFPSQTQRFWRVVRSCTRHVFDPELATYPAVLLMVGEKKHAGLASRIAEAVQLEFEKVKGQHPSAGELNADEQKLVLDKWLKEKLDNRHVGVVVTHLETLLPEAALLLHGYCDGDNAPYKEALLILGLFLDRPVDSQAEAEKALSELWKSDFMKDKIGALLSRIANNIVLVQGPSNDAQN
ncbi:torsin-1A-interacting protein 2-like [Babylonia areolata]|uniref:torsin-1A-interacting protein 2-like n=1 Tax=Babylonia areolata TaxID=304850 RepID=UPI003FD4E4D6